MHLALVIEGAPFVPGATDLRSEEGLQKVPRVCKRLRETFQDPSRAQEAGHVRAEGTHTHTV